MKQANLFCFAFLGIFTCSPPQADAQNAVKVQNFINSKDWTFVENKGQLVDGLGLQIPNSDVKYYSHSGGVNLYCHPGKISFVFLKIENDENVSEATGK